MVIDKTTSIDRKETHAAKVNIHLVFICIREQEKIYWFILKVKQKEKEIEKLMEMKRKMDKETTT
jgi:hypothetical protein